jgi:hypothetical protein
VTAYAQARADAQADATDPDRRRREFDRKTVGLVVDQFRRGVLPEVILLALLSGCGLEVPEDIEPRGDR